MNLKAVANTDGFVSVIDIVTGDDYGTLELELTEKYREQEYLIEEDGDDLVVRFPFCNYYLEKEDFE